LKEYRELKLMYPNNEMFFHESRFQIVNIHILRQEYDQARQELDNYLNEVPAKPIHRAVVQSYRALFFYYTGEISRAFSITDSILANQSLGFWIKFSTSFLKFYFLLDQNNIADAHQQYLSLLADYRNQFNRKFKRDIYKAMLFLKEGELDSCRHYKREILAQVAGDKDLNIMAMLCDFIQAELFLVTDSCDKAIDYYNQIQFRLSQNLTSPDFNRDYNVPLEWDIVPRALIKKGDIDGAIEAYEKITDFQPDQKNRFFINPKYHYRLAKLYQQDGQRQKAIERYKRFLGIWKYADEDLPEKVDAERRLAALLEEVN
jgi:tetratricopeptide (TPR) repeat protein